MPQQSEVVSQIGLIVRRGLISKSVLISDVEPYLKMQTKFAIETELENWHCFETWTELESGIDFENWNCSEAFTEFKKGNLFGCLA
jgi:hypothetical protein